MCSTPCVGSALYASVLECWCSFARSQNFWALRRRLSWYIFLLKSSLRQTLVKPLNGFLFASWAISFKLFWSFPMMVFASITRRTLGLVVQMPPGCSSCIQAAYYVLLTTKLLWDCLMTHYLIWHTRFLALDVCKRLPGWSHPVRAGFQIHSLKQLLNKLNFLRFSAKNEVLIGNCCVEDSSGSCPYLAVRGDFPSPWRWISGCLSLCRGSVVPGE